jgi:hypothetical protein
MEEKRVCRVSIEEAPENLRDLLTFPATEIGVFDSPKIIVTIPKSIKVSRRRGAVRWVLKIPAMAVELVWWIGSRFVRWISHDHGRSAANANPENSFGVINSWFLQCLASSPTDRVQCNKEVVSRKKSGINI